MCVAPGCEGINGTGRQWVSHYDAANQAGLSRFLGGIYAGADDVQGRIFGGKTDNLA